MKWEVYMYQIFLISTTRDKINMNTHKNNRRKYYCLVEQLRRDNKVVYFHMDEDGHFTGTTYIRRK
jgi:hypothetical protein